MKYKNISIVILILLLVIFGLSYCNCIKAVWTPRKELLEGEKSIMYIMLMG